MRWVRMGMVGALAALAVSGCSSTGGATAPLNAAAKKRGPISFAFVNTGAGSGPVQIVMADGEVLNGSYRGGALNGGAVQFVASGPRTKMRCSGQRTLAGNGVGQCQSAGGALWSISW